VSVQIEQVCEAVSDCAKEAIRATLAAISGAEPVCRGEHEESMPFDGVVGIMSFVGDVEWSLMLGFPRETAIALGPRFAGFEIEYESEDMADVVGELANVVSGDALARLDARGLKAEMSLPTVVRGSDMELVVSDKVPWRRCLRFETLDGDFWLKLAVVPCAEAHRRAG